MGICCERHIFINTATLVVLYVDMVGEGDVRHIILACLGVEAGH